MRNITGHQTSALIIFLGTRRIYPWLDDNPTGKLYWGLYLNIRFTKHLASLYEFHTAKSGVEIG